MEVQKPKRKWQHPIPLSLIESYDQSVGIEDIIDSQAQILLDSVRSKNPELFSSATASIPIEKILWVLDIDVAITKHGKASGMTELIGSRTQITLRTKNQHYFRQRFTLAHELGHIWLRRLAGPFTYEELAQTKDTNYEEEYLCDLFAASLLMPKSVFLANLREDEISRVEIVRLANEFKVSIGAVLRRLAGIKNSILLFWSEISNPLNHESERTERIESVYPNLYQASKHFVPLYCTPRDTRFEPNIILRSLEAGEDTSGEVRIRDFGSLPERSYRVHNIFFKRGSKDMYKNAPRHRQYDMATLIELADAEDYEDQLTYSLNNGIKSSGSTDSRFVNYTTSKL